MFDTFTIMDTFKSLGTFSESFYLMVPGFKKDEIKVTSKDNMLNISGEVKRDDAIAYTGTFGRTNSFNYKVFIDPKRKVTKVSLEDGILYITLDTESKKAKEKSYKIS